MNKTVLETKQGADSSADLPTQPQPQLKVVEPKPSAGSSYGEKLVTGFSIIRVKNKRLSGAQRRKLIGERKMKKGTWKDERPPGKTPSSRDKGEAECSGGVRRPNSDSSTPSRETQQTKKPRSTQAQNAAYKEAVTGIKMAIIHKHHPEVKLEDCQNEIIQAKRLSAVNETL